MATYVFTDIHGHAKPLRRILERIAPQDEDQFISPRLDDLSEEDKRKVHAIVKDLMGA